jgi:hypothetical protein
VRRETLTDISEKIPNADRNRTIAVTTAVSLTITVRAFGLRSPPEKAQSRRDETCTVRCRDGPFDCDDALADR